MNALTFLNQAIRIDDLLKSHTRELEEVEELYKFCINISTTDAERVQTSPTGEPRYTLLVEKKDLLENEIVADIESLFEAKRKIRTVINMVDDDEQKLILRHLFLEYKTYPHHWDIYNAMGISRATFYRLYHDALKKVQEILQFETL